MTIRFGVIGAGRIGKVHARTIATNPKAKLSYIADALPKAAQDLAGTYGARSSVMIPLSATLFTIVSINCSAYCVTKVHQLPKTALIG